MTALAVSALFPQTITGVALDMVWSIEGTISSWHQLMTNVEMVDESSLGEIWDGMGFLDLALAVYQSKFRRTDMLIF